MSNPISIERQQKIREYLQMIEAISASTDDYLYLVEADTGLVHFTNHIHLKYQLPNCSKEGFPVADWVKTIYPRDAKTVMEDLQRVLDGTQQDHNMEYRLLDRQGNRCWISCRGVVQKDEAGQPLMLLGRVSDTVLGQKTDVLTGLFNGRKYAEDLTASLNRHQSGCLLIFGLDNFKDINIKYGRSYGNHILKQFADALEEHVAPRYPAYRLDGDRFALNLCGQDQATASKIYEQLRQAVSFCTISAGSVLYTAESSCDGETLYQYAESALDHAKKDGKNRLFFFSFDDYREHQNSLELLEEMRHSVSHDFKGFFLCYQPQLQCQSCRICGVEALLRFQSPSRGIISPVEFIPLLEQSRLIVPVGEWVLRTALQACRKWRLSLPCLRISVNLSYIQLLDEHITATVLDILRESGLSGDALTLELTESVQLQNYEYYNRIFYRWEVAGIRIAIDDFGTGYSSLGYLKNLCLDEIKIDRCFITGIQHSTYNYCLLRNTIELARSSQIHICCEGVETMDELTVLKELLPDTLQGYLFSAPCTPDIFEQLYINPDSNAFYNRLQLEERCRAIGTSKKETLQPALRKKFDFESNVSACARIFARGSETETALQNLLASVAGFYGADHAYIYTPVRDDANWHCRASWYTDHASLSRKLPQMLSTSVIDRWISYFTLGESVIIETPNDILSGSPLELELLHCQNVTGLIAVPISRCGQTIGFIGVSNPSEHPANDNLLFVAACFVADRLNQNTSTDCAGDLPALTSAEVLARTQLGLWKILVHDDLQQCELFTDDIMRRTLGLTASLTPQQCFLYWYTRISDESRHYVDSALQGMNETNQIVQIEYTWQHPLLGNSTVRFLGLRTKDHNGTICLCGYHRLLSNIERLTLPTDTDQKQILELESARKNDFYEAILSETIAYAELDLETGWPINSGGLWEHYEEECRQWSETFLQAVTRSLPRIVAPEYHDACCRYFAPEQIRSIYDSVGSVRKYCYRRIIGNDFHWVELSIHVFREHFTSHRYALLYLKDIDMDKKRELAQISAANTDPLTKVYNRRTFQAEVEAFMNRSDKSACGALILFDIDNFKQINDLHGHPQGDAALLHMNEVLQSTFRQRDLIGRLGGDEFLAFIKDVSKRHVLNQRMEELSQALSLADGIPITFSAGITFVHQKNFSYERILDQADQALYHSKQHGKARTTYYEDMV